MVGLLDVAVLVRHAERVGGRLHPVVPHQRAVAILRQGPSVAIERVDRRAQMIGAVPLGDAPELPEAALDPFDQRFEALGEADLDRFYIRVAEHQVEEQVRERHPAQRDPKRCHVREVGLRIHARQVDLGEDHLLARAVLGTPGGDLPLQRPQLHRPGIDRGTGRTGWRTAWSLAARHPARADR